jgi:hypothetical protein
MTILFCLAAMAAVTVAASGADLSGHYYLRGEREVGSELLLRPDGKFQFMFAYGAADYWAEGTWNQKDGAVILNSTQRENSEPFRLVRSSLTNAAAIRVRVVGEGGQAVPNIDVALLREGGHETARTDSEGTAMFQRDGKPTAVVFAVRVYEFESDPIKIDGAHDDFTFQINGKAITEVRFAAEKLTVDKGALVMMRFGPDHPMRYEK